MRAEDDIVRAEVGTDPDRNGLLADVGMAGAVNQAALMRLRPAANEHHRAKQTQHRFLFHRIHREFFRSFRGASEPPAPPWSHVATSLTTLGRGSPRRRL